MIEKEYKFQIDNKHQIESRLREMGAVGGERVHELTVMYDNPDKIMEKKDGRLRIRTRKCKGKEEIQISYKKPLSRAGIKQEIEYQTVVGNKEMMERIIDEMGFFPVSSYERYRTEYHIGNGKESIEISIDELPFGNYIEIEGNNIDAMRNVATRLGLNLDEHIENSYDGIFNDLERKEGKIPTPHIRFKT